MRLIIGDDIYYRLRVIEKFHRAEQTISSNTLQLSNNCSKSAIKTDVMLTLISSALIKAAAVLPSDRGGNTKRKLRSLD